MKIVFADYNAKQHHVGKVYTCCVGKAGQADNLEMFTPLDWMVYGHKAWKGDKRFVRKYKPVNDQQYEAAYGKLLRTRPIIGVWLQFLSRDVTICCFCKEGQFCHRRLLFKWFKAFFAKCEDVEIVLH